MKLMKTYPALSAHATPDQFADWLRVWIAAPINGSEPQQQAQRLMAVQELSKLGQAFPVYGYRALALDKSEVTTWTDLDKFLNGDFPESYAFSIGAVGRYLKSTGGAADPSQYNVIFAGRVPTPNWMVNVNALIYRLPVEEIEKPCADGRSLRDHLIQEELIAVPGTLKRMLQNGCLYTVGYTEPGSTEICRTPLRQTPFGG